VEYLLKGTERRRGPSVLDTELHFISPKMLKVVMKMRHDMWEKITGKSCIKAHSWK
jgi:hypothetical protein